VILDIERVAHDGSCVAHAPDGRVVFVRHTLPGERVEVRITDERKRFLRADAVTVLEPAATRVIPPCPWAGPGKCGGCDWQHVALDEQRRLKGTVVNEQLRRLAGLDCDVVVEPVPGDETGLGWRTRMRLAVDDDGRAGLRRYHSHEVEPIDDCLIAAPALAITDVVRRDWPPGAEVSVEATSTGDHAISTGRPDDVITETAAGRRWEVPVGGFWQVHRGAADLLTDVVLEMVGTVTGERCLDLYAGVGLFAGVLTGAGAQVTAVESDARAVAAGRRNVPGARFVSSNVDRWLAHDAPPTADVVVLDPPRRGAGAAVVERIAALGPSRICYVACDPGSLARDVGTLARLGYRIVELRAFDLFPMTAHVETVALLTPDGAGGPA
jgi:tRNA/tmRNA/rRNA uracil-C5-methylase (TrmA/RlmC/RlmD family)